MADLDKASDKVHDALSRIIRDEQEAMVTRWVCLVEVTDTDGERAMWSLCSDGLPLWHRIGMVEFHNRTLRPEVGDE
jgi:hypothetical protein